MYLVLIAIGSKNSLVLIGTDRNQEILGLGSRAVLGMVAAKGGRWCRRLEGGSHPRPQILPTHLLQSILLSQFPEYITVCFYYFSQFGKRPQVPLSSPPA